MSFRQTKSTADYQFEVEGEPPIDHAFNSANGQFQPSFVRVTLYDGRLFDVFVQGPLINAKGKLLRRFGMVSWNAEDVRTMTGEDAPPLWIKQLVDEVTSHV